MKELDHFYLHKDELVNETLLAVRDFILSQDKNIHSSLQYGMPFFFYQDKRFCYLWVHKKYNFPYLGLVEGKSIDHPDLISEKRSRMKILLIDPHKDLPLKTILDVLKQALNIVRGKGIISLPTKGY